VQHEITVSLNLQALILEGGSIEEAGLLLVNNKYVSLLGMLMETVLDFIFAVKDIAGTET
jgi:hypothetical protein